MTVTPRIPKDQLFGIRFLDDIAEWIGENLLPEDVFTQEALAGWARGDGYVHESTIEKTQSDAWRELWEQWFNQDVVSPWYYDMGQDAEFCIGCGNNREYGHNDSCIIAKAKALLERSKESAQ